ncbi:anti-sigma regulatory factor [Flavobacterium selenitireducens]|uniref:anti-sigma regulatory factor n=1 Tax=Flavobacterium selenitireducens TaxID=2722704 RepID=UPI00168A4A31|nr:anti-sigma regulatory factor [Flavobacterium selenitireducens]MBD3581875.1 anti-sigma regulatory factor [Flavobacterium selenitireducens]
MTFTVQNREEIAVTIEKDAIFFRNAVKTYATKISMGLLYQTKIITAASEIVRNLLKYGGGGKAMIETVTDGRKVGIRLTFKDSGPGIPDLDKAMSDGFSTGKSLGLGLPGAKRLVDQFDIRSTVGVGTTVTLLKWK